MNKVLFEIFAFHKPCVQFPVLTLKNLWGEWSLVTEVVGEVVYEWNSQVVKLVEVSRT